MMKKAGEFDNILDECLEKVLIKGETIEQCLAGHPDYAAELEPLLRTALVAREASAIKPRPEFRERASYQFQAALREVESKRSRGFFGWQPRWVTAVIVVIVLLLAGSGTVMAAGDSLPDEPLYQVKLATEAVRLTLTPSATGKAELYVKLADKRVAEIVKMADKGKVKQVEEATERLDEYLVAMASLTVPAGEEVMEGQVATFEAEQPMIAVEEAPVPAPEPAPAAQEQLRKAPPPAVEKAPASVAPSPAPPPGLSKDAGQGKGRGKEVTADKQAELRMVLSRCAAENHEALQAVLEQAPESVKPALRRAIEVADAGYEQALSNLD